MRTKFWLLNLKTRDHKDLALKSVLHKQDIRVRADWIHPVQTESWRPSAGALLRAEYSKNNDGKPN
jgi:hypothetical protein